MLQAQASERELLDQFLAAFRTLREVHVELKCAAAPGHDAQLALDVAGKSIHALAEVRKDARPVRELERERTRSPNVLNGVPSRAVVKRLRGCGRN